MKKNSVKILLSAIMLVFSAVLFVGVAIAWFAVNNDVGGDAGDVTIEYDRSGGSADFVPGDGFGTINPDNIFSGDILEYKFSLKNDSSAEKQYAFKFIDLATAYPTSDTKNNSDYLNIVTAADDYEYKEGSNWYKYSDLRDAADVDKIAFYEKFVTSITNAFKIAIIPDDEVTPLADAAAANIDKFMPITEVESYYNTHKAVDFYDKTETMEVDGTTDAPLINNKLESLFGLTAPAGTTAKYRFIMIYDGDKYSEIIENGITYRMKNSNAFMWQKISATVVVKDIV